MPAIAVPATDPFSRLMATVPEGGAPQGATAPAASDPFSRLMATAGTEEPSAPVSEKAKPGVVQSLAAGAYRGARDVIDTLANWGDEAFPGVNRIGAELGLPTTEQANAYETAARQNFQNEYGNSTAATIGRAGGNLAVAAPIMAAGGEALAPALGGAAEVVPAAVRANKLAQLGTLAGKGAAQGAAANALVSSASNEPLTDQLRQGAELGAGFGLAGPVAYKAGKGLVDALTGGGVSPAVADLAQKAEDFGIPIRAGQISASPFVKYADSFLSKMPLTGYAAKDEQAREAFTRAVSNTFGEDSPSLTQQVMSSARSRIGGVFNKVAANTTIGPEATDSLVNQLAQIETDGSQTLPESEFRPIKNQLANIISKVSPEGEISGETYQALTRKGAPLDSVMNSKDPNIRAAGSAIRNALDDALEASASPEDMSALQQARLQWKNMRTVQDLAAKAGVEGEISPAALLGAVKKSYKDMPYSGAGQIGDLANIGQRFLKEQPSSGTGERIAILEMLRHPGLPLATLTGGGVAFEHPSLALPTAAGFLLSSRLAASALNSNLYRKMLLRSALRENPSLANQLFNGVVNNPLVRGASPYAVPAGVLATSDLQRGAASPVLP